MSSGKDYCEKRLDFVRKKKNKNFYSFKLNSYFRIQKAMWRNKKKEKKRRRSQPTRATHWHEVRAFNVYGGV
jgi:hypothetical protein